MRHIVGAFSERAVRLASKTGRKPQAHGPFQRCLALVPLLELVMRLAEVVEQIGVILACGGSFRQELHRSRVKFAAIARDAQRLRYFCVARISLAGLLCKIIGLRGVGRPLGIKDGKLSGSGRMKRIGGDDFLISLNRLVRLSVQLMQLRALGERARIVRLAPEIIIELGALAGVGVTGIDRQQRKPRPRLLSGKSVFVSTAFFKATRAESSCPSMY